jgi:hypothetical protein
VQNQLWIVVSGRKLPTFNIGFAQKNLCILKLPNQNPLNISRALLSVELIRLKWHIVMKDISYWSRNGRSLMMIDSGLKGKVKLFLCLTKHHAMKTYWRSGGIAPRILELGTRWK